jgi:ankyrin repeat protein
MFGAREALLHDAVRVGDLAKVGKLLDDGADVNSADRHGDTPLHKSALQHARGMSDLLVFRGADVDGLQKYGMTPLDVAGPKSELTAFLRSKGGKSCKELP